MAQILQLPSKHPAAAFRTKDITAWSLVVAIAAAAIWLMFAGWQALAESGNLAHALRTAQGQMVGPVLFIVVIAIFIAERKWPAVERPAFARAHVVDALYLLIFVVIGPLIALLNTGFAVELTHHASWLILDKLSLLPQAIIVALILLGIDATNWLAHVANHRYEVLWRLHALHHSQEDLSVFTTFRTHPLMHASYLLALLPALVLESSGTLPATAVIVYGCLVALPHANLRWDYGPAGKILISPAYHRLHHARTPINGKLAVNYGFVLTCWDRMAQTAVFPTDRTPISTGIGGRPVPIEQTSTRFRLFHTLWLQIVQPFRINP